MAYKIDWLVKERVLLTTFSGVITQPELAGFINDIRTEIPKGRPIVYHISNSLALEKVELSLKTFRTMLGAYQMVKELGWQIDVNTNALNKMFSNLGAQFARIRTRTYPTLEEAIAFLREIDPSLEKEVWVPVAGFDIASLKA